MERAHFFAGSVVAAAIAGGTWGLQPSPGAAVAAMTPVPVHAQTLPLDPDRPGRDTLGMLRFLGAIRLTSPNGDFGGISGLAAGRGYSLLGVTDTGDWVAFDTLEQGGRLTGVADVRMAPILGRDGRPAVTKADGDAEALAWEPATGTAQVSYEQVHRIMHFAAAPGGPVGRVPVRDERLTQTVGWNLNGGGEALALLPGGTQLGEPGGAQPGEPGGAQPGEPGGARLLVRETDDAPAGAPAGTREALLTLGGRTRTVFVPGIPGHSPTDAVAIDATRVLLLHRRFTPLLGQGAAITLVDLAPVLAGGTRATARELARWAPPLALDNMEGLAARREGGTLMLYVISDDNLNPLQKTVLLKFAAPGL